MTASRFVKETKYIESYLNLHFKNRTTRLYWIIQRLKDTGRYRLSDIGRFRAYNSFWLNCWLLVNDVSHEEINKMSIAQKLTYIHLFGDSDTNI